MRRTERVVFAFGPLGEAGKPAAHPQRANAVAPAGQDLVRIGLVTDVPDQAVVRRVEHVVQGNGELDHPQAGAEMAAGDRDRVDGLLAQLVRQLAQLPALEPAQISRRLDQVEEGGAGRLGHWQNSTDERSRATYRLGETLTRRQIQGKPGTGRSGYRISPFRRRGNSRFGWGVFQSGAQALIRSGAATNWNLMMAPRIESIIGISVRYKSEIGKELSIAAAAREKLVGAG